MFLTLFICPVLGRARLGAGHLACEAVTYGKIMLSAISLARRLLRDILKHIVIFGIASLFFGGVIGPAGGIVSHLVFGNTYKEARSLVAILFAVVVAIGVLLGAAFGGFLAISDWRWTRRGQNQLRLRGYYDGPSDGWLNSDTREALLEFQRSEGLTVTGRFDDATMTRLGL